MAKKFMVVLLGFSLFLSCRNQIEKDEEFFIFQWTMTTLSQGHYLQKNHNDAFFNQSFNHFMKEVDRQKLFFSKQEVDRLLPLINPYVEDEDIYPSFQRTVGKLPEAVHEIVQEKIKVYRKIAVDFFSQPIDFTSEDFYETSFDQKNFSADSDQAAKRWVSYLKYYTLVTLLEGTDRLGSSNVSVSSSTNTYDQEEKKARELTWPRIKRELLTYETRKERDYFDFYISGIGASYDQYTTYSSPVNNQTFNIGISAQLEGIGAQIGKSEDGSIEVMSVIVGGPSFKQKALKRGDKIFKVAQEGKEYVDLIPLTLNEALTHIRGKKGTKVKLFVTRSSGKKEEVVITRGKIILADLYLKTLVLDTVKGKYGYIEIPKFYGNPYEIGKSPEGIRRVSEDMEKALRYLNQQKVEGLIVDLRNNGGGFLGDCIRIASFFIGDGPVVRVKNRREERILSDSRKKILFDKPLVIMINGISASASEIFAAAMQDYRRAVIVGSEQSFGKATVQGIIPFKVKKLNLGSLKYTTQKYYRITGQSTQTKGVKSDIVLPSLDNIFNFVKKHSFPIDTLNSMRFSRWTNRQLDLSALALNSRKRIDQIDYFVNLRKRKKIREEYNQYNQKTLRSLNYKKERKSRNEYLARIDDYKINLPQATKYFKVDLKQKETLFGQGDSDDSKNSIEIEKAKWLEWAKDTFKDLYLLETVRILEDVLADGR